MPPEAFREVVGDGGFFANVLWEREGSWEIGACEEASKAARCGSRAAVPGAGGDGGLGGGEIGEDRASEERRCPVETEPASEQCHPPRSEEHVREQEEVERHVERKHEIDAARGREQREVGIGDERAPARRSVAPERKNLSEPTP